MGFEACTAPDRRGGSRQNGQLARSLLPFWPLAHQRGLQRCAPRDCCCRPSGYWPIARWRWRRLLHPRRGRGAAALAGPVRDGRRAPTARGRNDPVRTSPSLRGGLRPEPAKLRRDATTEIPVLPQLRGCLLGRSCCRSDPAFPQELGPPASGPIAAARRGDAGPGGRPVAADGPGRGQTEYLSVISRWIDSQLLAPAAHTPLP